MQILDNETFDIGTSTDYWFVYDTANTRFEFWTTNKDGQGSDGIVWRCIDGTNDVKFYGKVETEDGIKGLCSAGYGVYGVSVSSLGVYGQSESNAGVRAHSDDSDGIRATSNTDRAGSFIRNTSGSSRPEVVLIEQGHVSDDGDSLVVKQDGAGDILQLIGVASNSLVVDCFAKITSSNGAVFGDDIDIDGRITAYGAFISRETDEVVGVLSKVINGDSQHPALEISGETGLLLHLNGLVDDMPTYHSYFYANGDALFAGEVKASGGFKASNNQAGVTTGTITLDKPGGGSYYLQFHDGILTSFSQ